MVEAAAQNLHIGGIQQVGGQGGLGWLVGQIAAQMGAPEAAAQALFGGGEVWLEDVVGTGRDGDGTPARIAHDRMAAQALAIALQIGQHEGHGGVGRRVVVEGDFEALAELSLIVLEGGGQRWQQALGLGRIRWDAGGRGLAVGQVLGGEAQHVAQLTEQVPAVLEALGGGGRSLEPVQILQGGADLVEQALFAGRVGRGQAALALGGESLAAAVEVQLGQREGVGGMLAPGAFQEPQQERGQVLAQALGGPAAGSQQVAQTAAQAAVGELAAQLGVVLIEQALADRGQEMVVAEQVGDAALGQGGDCFGDAAAEVADGGQRVAEGGHGACDGGPQLALVFGSDLEREQDPAGEPVQAQERAAPALVAGGIEM